MVQKELHQIRSLQEYNSVIINMLNLVKHGRAEQVAYQATTGYQADDLHVFHFDEGYTLRVIFDNSKKKGIVTFFGQEEMFEITKSQDLPLISGLTALVGVK